jgi:hypothetical protein
MTGMIAAAALGRARALLGGAIVPALLAGLVAVAIWGWLGNRRADKFERVAESTKLALDRQISAHGTTVQSLEALIRATRAQTAMVRELAATADRRQAAAQAALAKAKERGAVAEATARRIEGQHSAGGPMCRTSPAVMDARGEL